MASGASGQMIPALKVVASSDGHESRGEALILCSAEGECILPGLPPTEPKLPVRRRSVVEVRPDGDVVSVSAVLARLAADAYADASLGEATPTGDGPWAVQLPDDLRRARFLEFEIELASGPVAFAWIPLEVVPGVSDDEAPQAATSAPTVAAGEGGDTSSDGIGWIGLAGASAVVVLLIASAVAALAVLRRRSRRRAEALGSN
ncbi:MAG: hypothetical protein ACRDNI_13215 [Gaiellaceae bacterium]